MNRPLPTIVAMGLFLMSIHTISRASSPDVAGKVVLANLDRYAAVVRIGKTRREIKPKKASLLTPQRYPVTIEFWSGNTRIGWQQQTIAQAGTYGFNFRQGKWTLTELKKRTAASPVMQTGTRVGRQATATRPSSRTIRQRIVSQPARRLPINADPNRWSPLARAAYAAGMIYQFVRDEQDRDLLRHLLIRAREDEDWNRLEDWLRDAKIPELYKNDLREAFSDLGRLSDEEWKEIDTADQQDWNQARADLGDLISDAEWSNLEGDFAEVDTGDYWQDNVNFEPGDLDIVDNVEIDQGQFEWADGMELAEGYDVGELGVDQGAYDLGGYDDFGGYDGAMDVDVGDYGGGYFGDNDMGDFGGFDDGGFDGGGFDDF